LNQWPQIRAVLRDVGALLLGLYIGVRAANPPITVDDLPAFTAAAGFMGIPFVARSKDADE
jgi:hypothetical protein